MRITVLGSGTSTGVPVPACKCSICTSNDPKNKRLRTSIYIQFKPNPEGLEKEPRAILIDTSTDLRSQILREDISKIDAVLYTHCHADHVYGIDDLRCFNFIGKKQIPLYAGKNTIEEFKIIFHYIFSPDPKYKGGGLPKLSLHEIRQFEPFSVFGEEILPLPVKHGKTDVLGFRIRNFAYITDCSFIPEETIKHLQGLDVLILDGLRESPHPTHLTHKQAVEAVEKIKPKVTYLTHITHEVDHSSGNKKLSKMTKEHVELAYDGLVVETS